MNIIEVSNIRYYIPENTVFLRDSNCITVEYIGNQPITTLRSVIQIHADSVYEVSGVVYSDNIVLNINNVLKKIYNNGSTVSYIEITTTGMDGLTLVFSDTITTLLQPYSPCSIIRDGVTLPNRAHYSERDIYIPPQQVFNAVHNGEERQVYTSTIGNITVNGNAYQEGSLIPLSPSGDDCVGEIEVDLSDNNFTAWKMIPHFWTYGVSQVNPLSVKFDDDLVGMFLKILPDGVMFSDAACKEYARENGCQTFTTAVFVPQNIAGRWTLSYIIQYEYDNGSYVENVIDLNEYGLYTDFEFLTYNYLKEDFKFEFRCNIYDVYSESAGYMTFETALGNDSMTGIRYTVNRRSVLGVPSFWGTSVPVEDKYTYLFRYVDDINNGYEMIGGLIGRYATNADKTLLDSIRFFKQPNGYAASSSLGGNVFVTAEGLWSVNTQNRVFDTNNYSIAFQLFQALNPTSYYSVTMTLWEDGRLENPYLMFDKWNSNAISTFQNVSLIRGTVIVDLINGVAIKTQQVEFVEIDNHRYRGCIVLEDNNGNYYDQNGSQVGYKSVIHIEFGDIENRFGVTTNACDYLCDSDEIRNGVWQEGDDTITYHNIYRDGVLLGGIERIKFNVVPVYQVFPFNCPNYAILRNGFYAAPQWCIMYRELEMRNTNNLSVVSSYNVLFNLGYDTEQDGVFYPATRQVGRFGVDGTSTSVFKVNDDFVHYISDVFNASTVVYNYFTDDPMRVRYECCVQHDPIYLDDENGTPTTYNIITNQLCEGQSSVMWIRYQNTDGFERWLYGKVVDKTFETENLKVGGIYPKENTINLVPIYHTSGFAEKIKLAFCDVPKHCYIEDILQSPFIEVINYTGTTRYYSALEETSITRNDEPYQDFVLTFVKKY